MELFLNIALLTCENGFSFFLNEPLMFIKYRPFVFHFCAFVLFFCFALKKAQGTGEPKDEATPAPMVSVSGLHRKHLQHRYIYRQSRWHNMPLYLFIAEGTRFGGGNSPLVEFYGLNRTR